MKSSQRKPSANAQGPNPPALGELVVQNGRQGGARRPLSGPLTLVGKDESCHIQLNVGGVSPFHCALIYGPEGLLLRDLNSESGTLVNGEPADTCPLHNDDLLTVGPFRFRVRLPKPAKGDPASGKGDRTPQIKSPVPFSGPQEKAVTEGGTDLKSVLPGPQKVLEQEKDALRIQAAAVAAQQAALTEEETRLQQRRVALEQQEKQLAAHLEEKRRQILTLYRQTRKERTELQQQHKAQEQRLVAATSDLAKERQQLGEVWQQHQAQRNRLLNLHRRLKQRWQRHWTAERQAQDRQAEELAAERRTLEKEAERLQQEKEALAQAQLRVNGECDLNRRQAKAGWKELRQAEQQWRERLADEKRAQQEKERQLEQRKTEVARGERELENEKQQWQGKRLHLEKEIEGLENRIRNHRRKILDQEQEVVRLDSVIRAKMTAETDPGKARAAATPPEGVIAFPGAFALPRSDDADLPSPKTAPGPVAFTPKELEPRESQLHAAEQEVQQRLATLEKLSGELADQRLHLTEQWERLLQAQQSWEKDHQAAAAELEATALRLQEQEQSVNGRAGAVASGECTLRQRLTEVLHLRQNLEGCQGRLRTRVKTWEAERDNQLIEMRAREKLAERRLAGLDALRVRWEKRRRQELNRLQASLANVEKVRQEYTAQREEWLGRKDALEKQERDLTEKNLALEQYRLEVVRQGINSAAVEKRLERLRRRWAALNQTAERDLAQHRQNLQAELAHLEERCRQWDLHAQKVAAQEAKLADLHASWENEQARAKDKYDQMRQKVHILLAQRHRSERQVGELRDEVERLAQMLMGEPDKTKIPVLVTSADAA